MKQPKTIAALAKALNVSVSTVSKALRSGFIEREKDGSFDPKLARQGVEAQASRRGGRSLGGQSGGMPAALVALKAAQAREELKLTRAKRKTAEQHLGRQNGELLNKSEWLRKWTELFMNFRDALLQVGSQIALRCDGKKAREISEIVRTEHERILKELADGGERLNNGGVR